MHGTTDRTAHRQLYKKLPSFTCKAGCTGCCGPVPVTRWEADRLGIAGARITPTKNDGLSCAFAVDGRCSVYEKRPFMCRLFGVVDTPILSCPQGCRPKRLLSAGEGAALRDRYIGLVEL